MKRQFIPATSPSCFVPGRSCASDCERSFEKAIIWIPMKEYSAVSVSNDINVVLVEDGSRSIQIRGERQLVNGIKLEVSKGELKVSSTRGSVCNRVRVVVPVQNLKRLKVSGSSEIHSKGILESERLDLRIDGPCLVSVKTKGYVSLGQDSASRPMPHAGVYN